MSQRCQMFFERGSDCFNGCWQLMVDHGSELHIRLPLEQSTRCQCQRPDPVVKAGDAGTALRRAGIAKTDRYFIPWWALGVGGRP